MEETFLYFYNFYTFVQNKFTKAPENFEDILFTKSYEEIDK